MSQKKKGIGVPPSQRVGSRASVQRDRTEMIFNLYLIVEQGIIRGLAAKAYESSASDGGKMSFLSGRAASEWPSAIRYPLPERFRFYDLSTGQGSNGLSYETYLDMAREGRQLEVFEDIFKALDAPDDPMTCITGIVDGEPKIDRVHQY